MKYEIAKNLLDAGYKMIPWWSSKVPKTMKWGEVHLLNELNYNALLLVDEDGNAYLLPTLSNLIEACGDAFIALEQSKNPDGTTWSAEAYPVGTIETSHTPEEAVAKLWLELNKESYD